MRLSKLAWFFLITLFLLAVAGLMASTGNSGSLVMFDHDYSHNPLAWMALIPVIVVVVILAILVAAAACLAALGAVLVGLLAALVILLPFILLAALPFMALWGIWKLAHRTSKVLVNPV